MQNAFKDKDRENLVQLLNLVAERATFQMQVKDIIRFYGLLSWAQKELLEKIDGHIADIIKVHEPAEIKKKGK